MEGRGDMRKTPRSLQDLRRRISVKAKAEPCWCCWGLYVQVCKRETLREASQLAKANNGAPGMDGVTFEAIAGSGGDAFLTQRQDALVTRTYHPMRLRQKAIPKEGGKGLRTLSIPTIRDRVVQGALQLILEPIFAADFPPGSYGYRPKRSAHDAVVRVAEAIVKYKTRVIDVDLQASFDNIQPPLLCAKVAQRGNDPEGLHVLKLMRQVSGKKGVAQGGVLSP
jgi:RNA-directed DNA polymerase